MTTARLLIVDDDPLSIECLAEALDELYEIHFALNANEAKRQLQAQHYDLLLLDVILPGTDGYHLLQNLQAQENLQLPPVIFITGLVDVVAETKGLSLGAVDFINKPIHPEIVRARVHRHLETARKQRELERMAMSDALTGLSNRRHFDQSLKTELQRCARKNQPISLILLDIDHFKLFNDHYGHSEGDRCLRTIAKALQDAFPHPLDIVARVGGEEFACLMPSMPLDIAHQKAEFLLASLKDLCIPHAGSLVANHVTASIGVASLHKIEHLDQAAQLYLEADSMLYQAKEWGRNRVTCGHRPLTANL